MKKIIFMLFLISALLVVLISCTHAAADPVSDTVHRHLPEQVELFFIYEESCSSCDGTEEFFALVDERLGDDRHKYRHSIETINIFTQDGAARFEFLAYELLGRTTIYDMHPPILIINGIFFQGFSAIGGNLREAFLVAGHDLFERGYVHNPRYARTGDELFADFLANPNHITLVYLYRIVCPACVEIEPLIQDLPAYVEVDGVQVPVDLIRINTRSGNNRDRVMALFDAKNVPDEGRRVPCIITASGHYTGTEAIREMLESLGCAERIGFMFP